ncbi:MAG: hypothetical protein ACUVXA_16465 [Candidatus Jordarchaeum sp.]|uniref:hypothetical protein n=1 Tax=Candidatus Jordarchaeum sp. TaxID=2823881 RepID=UPI00404A6981
MYSSLSTGTKLNVIVCVIIGSAGMVIGLHYLDILINPPLLSFQLDWLVVASAIVFILMGVYFSYSAIQLIRKGRVNK